jgi:hypothetical protein
MKEGMSPCVIIFFPFQNFPISDLEICRKKNPISLSDFQLIANETGKFSYLYMECPSSV